jgi:hypothetical protein
MKKNLGSADRVVRVFVAAVIAILYLTDVITGIPATILLVLAGVFVATSLIGFCPLYALAGISTCPNQQKTS